MERDQPTVAVKDQNDIDQDPTLGITSLKNFDQDPTVGTTSQKYIDEDPTSLDQNLFKLSKGYIPYGKHKVVCVYIQVEWVPIVGHNHLLL